MTKPKPLPDQETLKRLLDYDPQAGVLTWKARTPDMFEGDRKANSCAIWNSRYAGQKAFVTVNSDGYAVGSIFGQSFTAHRIAFKVVYGYDPDTIDHINRDRLDNRIANLRDVSLAENLKNVSGRKPPFRHKGVYERDNGTFVAFIGGSKNRVHLGTYASEEEAIAKRIAAERLYGYLARNLQEGDKHKI